MRARFNVPSVARVLAVFVAVAIAAVCVQFGLWLLLVVATGGSYFECDKGDCGAVYNAGERWTDWAPFVVAGAAGFAAARRFAKNRRASVG